MKYALFLASCLAAAPVFGEEARTTAAADAKSGPTISGNVFADFYVSTLSTGNPFNQVSTLGWLNANSKLNDRSSATLIAEGRLIESSIAQGRPADSGTFGIREGYLNYSSGALDLSAGKEILPWGKADVISPTDFLSGKDYTFFSADEEVRRVGATLLKADYTLGQNWTLTGVVIPVPAFSKVLLPPQLVPAGTPIATLTYPNASFSNSEEALRLSYFGSGWDFALIYFHGWGKVPEYSAALGSTAVTLVPTPHKIDAVGLQGSWSPGKWVVRLDSAYVKTENNDGTNIVVQPSYLEAAIGLEYALTDHWRLQVQGIDKYFPNYTPIADLTGLSGTAELNQGIAILNSIVLGYQVRNRLGGTARIAYKSDAGWEAELFAMAFQPSGYLIRPKATIELTDNLKASFGSEYFGGEDRSQLGALHPFSSVFVEGKYSF